MLVVNLNGLFGLTWRCKLSDTLLLNADGSVFSVIPLSVIDWRETVRLLYLEKIVPIEYYSDWVVHSSSISYAMPSVIMTKQYFHKTQRIRFTKQNILLRDNFTCQYCGKQFHGHELTLDHYLPKSRGGKKNFENIITSCGPCNWARGDDMSIKPIKQPHRPTYFELVNARKKYPIYLKQKIWNQYLGWPEDLLLDKPHHGWGTFKVDIT